MSLVNKKIFKNLRSNSKINFGLWIKEKRSDGYHELETVFFENENLFDDIEIKYAENTKDKTRTVNVSFLQDDLNKEIKAEDNLAYKAAMLFLNELGIEGSCTITINKKIPLQGGLGGGSSNAATILKGLNQIFNSRLNQAELLNLACRLGSDVPFFIIGNTCYAKGRGEKLQEIKNNLNLDIKIVKPVNVSISTKWAYEQIDFREFTADHYSEISNLILAMKTGDYDLFYKSIFNDFEMVVFSYYPVLIKERNKLKEEGYKAVGLCGSGSCLFGLRLR